MFLFLTTQPSVLNLTEVYATHRHVMRIRLPGDGTLCPVIMRTLRFPVYSLSPGLVKGESRLRL